MMIYVIFATIMGFVKAALIGGGIGCIIGSLRSSYNEVISAFSLLGLACFVGAFTLHMVVS